MHLGVASATPIILLKCCLLTEVLNPDQRVAKFEQRAAVIGAGAEFVFGRGFPSRLRVDRVSAFILRLQAYFCAADVKSRLTLIEKLSKRPEHSSEWPDHSELNALSSIACHGS